MYAPEGHSERNNAPWFEAMTDESGWYALLLPVLIFVLADSSQVLVHPLAQWHSLRWCCGDGIVEHCEEEGNEGGESGKYPEGVLLQAAPVGAGPHPSPGRRGVELGDQICRRCVFMILLLLFHIAHSSWGVDYSYSATSYAGPNYRLVGDAASFIDPCMYFPSQQFFVTELQLDSLLEWSPSRIDRWARCCQFNRGIDQETMHRGGGGRVPRCKGWDVIHEIPARRLGRVQANQSPGRACLLRYQRGQL